MWAAAFLADAPALVGRSLTALAAVRMRGSDEGALPALPSSAAVRTRVARCFCSQKVVYALIACIRGWTPKIRIARFKL